MITNKNYNVYLPKMSDKKLMYEFADKMYFNVKSTGNKATRDRSLITLLKPSALLVSAFLIPNTLFLPSDANELCNG